MWFTQRGCIRMMHCYIGHANYANFPQRKFFDIDFRVELKPHTLSRNVAQNRLMEFSSLSCHQSKTKGEKLKYNRKGIPLLDKAKH